MRVSVWQDIRKCVVDAVAALLARVIQQLIRSVYGIGRLFGGSFHKADAGGKCQCQPGNGKGMSGYGLAQTLGECESTGQARYRNQDQEAVAFPAPRNVLARKMPWKIRARPTMTSLVNSVPWRLCNFWNWSTSSSIRQNGD